MATKKKSKPEPKKVSKRVRAPKASTEASSCANVCPPKH